MNEFIDYPVLQPSRFKKSFHFELEKKGMVEILVGIQNRIPVMGYEWQIFGMGVGCGGGGCYPSRKWGEFKSKKEAEIYALKHVWKRFSLASKGRKTMGYKVRPIVKAIKKRIKELRYLEQFELNFKT